MLLDNLLIHSAVIALLGIGLGMMIMYSFLNR